MKLWVGLGNPGAKYAGNRHNIGFMALDRVAEDHSFAPWRSKFQASLTEGRLGSEKVLLLKPETFMNLSGQSVGEAMRFYKLDSTDITVFHDELDLAPGKCRVKAGGGHAGHNGLRSIHQHIGPHYDRVRLGIGHPGHKYPLGAPTGRRPDLIKQLIQRFTRPKRFFKSDLFSARCAIVLTARIDNRPGPDRRQYQRHHYQFHRERRARKQTRQEQQVEASEQDPQKLHAQRDPPAVRHL